MTPAIILDTDFLSSFLKIDRLSLVRDFYGADKLLVPPAVYREVSLTNLLQRLASLSWVEIKAPSRQEILAGSKASRASGKESGKQSCWLVNTTLLSC